MKSKLCVFVAVATIAFSPPPIRAAERGEEPASEPEPEEVIVTTQQHEHHLHDVPVSATTLSGELIEDADIHDLKGVSSRTPSHFHASFSAGQHVVTLRGSGSNDDGAGTDSSVVLFLDGVYIGRSSNINFEMADLEHVEVVRGPQGVLGGKNAVGGAMKVVTRKPSIEEANGSINLTTGNYDLRYIAGFYSTPVANRWAIKVSGSSRVRDGWVGNALRPNDNLKNENAQVARVQTLYQGTSTAVLMALDANFLDADDAARIPIAGASLEQYKLDTKLANYDRKISANPTDGFARSYAGGFSIKVDHNFNGTDALTYMFGYRRFVADWEMDMVGSTVSELKDNILDKTWQNQHELRLNLDRRRWNTTVGLWWSNEQTRRTESFDIEGGVIALPIGSDESTQDNHTQSLAAYAHSEVSIGRTFYMAFGSRYTWEQKEIETISINGVPDFIVNEDFTVKADEAWSALSPKLTLGFRFEGHHHLYFDASTGFKSGGFPSTPTQVEHLQALKPETSTSFELAYKGMFAHGAIHWNTTLFFAEYTDMQIQQFGPRADRPSESEFGIFRTINISKAQIWGVESEFEYRPSVYFHIRANLTLNYSEYRDTQTLHTGGQFDGKALVHTPDNKYSLAIGGDVPVGNSHTFRWGLDYRYESKTLHDLTNVLAVSPAYSLLDARLTWIFPQGFELAWWGRNILDESWIHHIYSFGFGTIAVFGEPYTTGFTFKYSF